LSVIAEALTIAVPNMPIILLIPQELSDKYELLLEERRWVPDVPCESDLAIADAVLMIVPAEGSGTDRDPEDPLDLCSPLGQRQAHPHAQILL